MKRKYEKAIGRAFQSAVFDIPRDFTDRKDFPGGVCNDYWKNTRYFKAGAAAFELRVDGTDISGYGLSSGDLKFSLNWIWGGQAQEIWYGSQFGEPRRCPVKKYVERAHKALEGALPDIERRLGLFLSWGLAPSTADDETHIVLHLKNHVVVFFASKALLIDKEEFKLGFSRISKNHPSWAHEWTDGDFCLSGLESGLMEFLKQKMNAELLAEMNEKLRMDLVELAGKEA